MNDLDQAKKLISESKNIYIIPPQTNEPESVTSALALFYTLKELNKNVNLVIDSFPKNLEYLIPSLDYISFPKNLVISIPKKIADISQVYYEKNDNGLKIHLTLDKGSIKKDNVSFYFSEAKPDLIITLGIQDFKVQLLEKLDSFGFLLDSPLLNIDNNPENKRFGKINLVENTSLTEIVKNLAETINNGIIKETTANCLLTGLIIYTDSFKNSKITANIFETAAYLMKKGAVIKEIKEIPEENFSGE